MWDLTNEFLNQLTTGTVTTGTVISFDAAGGCLSYTPAGRSAEYGSTNAAYEESRRRAQERGLTVRTAGSQEIFLDLDTPESRRRFYAMLPILQKNFKVKNWFAEYSSSRNIHVTINMDEYILQDARLALQAILGSDPVKEMLTLRRSMDNIQGAVMLFRTPVPESATAMMVAEAAEYGLQLTGGTVI